MKKLNRKQFYNLTVGKDINGKDIKKNDDKFIQHFDIMDRDIQRYLTHKRGKDGAMSFFILVAIIRSTQFDSNNKWYNDNLLVMSDDDIILNIGKTSSPTIRKYIKILIDEKFIVSVEKGRGNVRIIEIDWNKLKSRIESLRGYAKKLDEEYFSGRNKQYKARIKDDEIANEPTLEPEINVEEEIPVNIPPVVVEEKIEPKKVEKVVEKIEEKVVEKKVEIVEPPKVVEPPKFDYMEVYGIEEKTEEDYQQLYDDITEEIGILHKENVLDKTKVNKVKLRMIEIDEKELEELNEKIKLDGNKLKEMKDYQKHYKEMM